MATSTFVREKPVPTPEILKEIVLKLTPEEATALRILFESVGGSKDNSLRKYIDRISSCLPNVESSKGLVGMLFSDKTWSTYYFRDHTKENALDEVFKQVTYK